MRCCNVETAIDRREMLAKCGMGLGAMALAELLAGESPAAARGHGALPAPHLAARANRVIYLFQSGGPSQLDLFDYKPLLNQRNGEQLPESVRQGQRLTAMSAGQASIPLAGSLFRFARRGQCGASVSELMPHTAAIVDELCFIKSMHTEAINHDPAVTVVQTGSQLAGRPAMGSWLSYGLGSENANLPAFIVLLSRARSGDQPLYSRLWGSGFLPSQHQGVQFRGGREPVVYLNDPDGLDRAARRRMLDTFRALEEEQHARVLDPEINARIAQYEMAYRMQTSVPDALDLAGEPDHIFDLYGPEAKVPGTYAANCLLARRLAERDVRFIQLYHQGWDQHSNLPKDIRIMADSVDRASAALVLDLKRRGLLEDTLVVWGGEFGRTNYSQGKLTANDYGRDHHPRCFTIWMAGGGIKPGITLGRSDEFGFNATEDRVHVHDLHATLLHLLGIDHERLTFKFQGRDYRLTDVHGEVVREILA
jgi:uncharacterized protein (DUF1501 family)